MSAGEARTEPPGAVPVLCSAPCCRRSPVSGCGRWTDPAPGDGGRLHRPRRLRGVRAEAGWYPSSPSGSAVRPWTSAPGDLGGWIRDAPGSARLVAPIPALLSLCVWKLATEFIWYPLSGKQAFEFVSDGQLHRAAGAAPRAGWPRSAAGWFSLRPVERSMGGGWRKRPGLLRPVLAALAATALLVLWIRGEPLAMPAGVQSRSAGAGVGGGLCCWPCSGSGGHGVADRSCGGPPPALPAARGEGASPGVVKRERWCCRTDASAASVRPGTPLHRRWGGAGGG
jgi:hypothetical protein